MEQSRFHRFFHAGSILILLAAILLASSIESSCELKKCKAKLYASKGHEIMLDVEIADTENARQKGLMYRMSLAENSGMLFIFEKDKRLSFWMKNTYIPLDIAFIDSSGVITDIMQMKPLDISVFYNSSTEVRYALEVNQWWFQKHGIKPGSKIGLHGCIGK
jgi:uncharacterized membrane protein (UPF0127 family)